ncbi:hypothetical protein GCM10010149_48850 [Nonomuraea roseoviolacea subsp. roseoviolacea]|uniref:Uncharacterized protein n=1 Tax=Nonomuraea roseoviolacea subsp. carminata TaxID=160689 RepID=A0ABT1KFB8_9ACTN|nr:hypothetical protein [Nonomuraea roseoviolacea]MCP2352710.1 hypothetical protein [Nonomuraea roseoviolacea subsp. carminata]
MRRWYVERDALDGDDIVIGEDSSPEETVRRILRDTGLPIGPPPV